MLYFLIKIKWTKDEIDEVQILTYNENERDPFRLEILKK